MHTVTFKVTDQQYKVLVRLADLAPTGKGEAAGVRSLVADLVAKGMDELRRQREQR